MKINFDRWTFLKLVELVLAVACLVYKRITDDEASRLFLYLQRLSRQWSLLNNVTWDRVGAAVADATYGGYVIITAALFFGRLFSEIPTHRRIIEYLLLGVGAILFIIMGSLEYAALDQVPPDLVDNAAVIGTLTLVEGLLFLLDLGGPKAVKPPKPSKTTQKIVVKELEPKNITQRVLEIEQEIEKTEKDFKTKNGDPQFETVVEKPKKSKAKQESQFELRGNDNGNGVLKGQMKDYAAKRIEEGYRRMSGEPPKKYGIYGKDATDSGGDSGTDEVDHIPPRMETHSPVWSQIRKGEYGKYDIVQTPYLYSKGKRQEERPPSTPGDPGYVQYLAQHWGSKSGQKTPRHSPTEV
ncbi:unnamed protein product [Brassicogethes aeneus]|uniref:Uncharacterized protein n=1 Tax=Brassicogethes aeneus TaxID=1431903 RepID=A0A9P0BLV8_BRAAE|nr:unnamed protein product [Brassicogethes aeneus]